MQLRNLPKGYRLALRSIKRKCKLTKTQLRFCVGPTVDSGSYDSDGYYVKGEIAIAMGKKKPSQWMKTLLHESCHLDQDTDKKLLEQNRRTGAAYDLVNAHLGGKKYPQALINAAFSLVIECEMDADRRAAKKILKWRLNEIAEDEECYNIDLAKYIQQSNAYANSYQLMKEGVEWDVAVQAMQDAHNIMPTDGIYEIEIHPQLRRFLNKRIAELRSKSASDGSKGVSL